MGGTVCQRFGPDGHHQLQLLRTATATALTPSSAGLRDTPRTGKHTQGKEVRASCFHLSWNCAVCRCLGTTDLLTTQVIVSSRDSQTFLSCHLCRGATSQDCNMDPVVLGQRGKPENCAWKSQRPGRCASWRAPTDREPHSRRQRSQSLCPGQLHLPM